MHPRLLVLLIFLAFTVPPCLAEKDPNAKATVTNPSASFLDVSARRAELAHATTPRVLEALSWKSGCVNSEQPAPPSGVMFIPHHYLSGSNGPINPQENIATAPYRKLDDAVSDGASRYVVTGDSREAVCIANLLDRWAAANSLLDYTYQESSQAWYPGRMDAQFHLAFMVRRPIRSRNSNRTARRDPRLDAQSHRVHVRSGSPPRR